MREFAYSINLKDDAEIIRQYKEHHANIWPEVSKSLKAVGIKSLNIYILGRRRFMVMQTVDNFDPHIDFPRYLTLDEKCQEWEDLMGTFQEKLIEAKADEKWASMDCIFQL